MLKGAEMDFKTMFFEVEQIDGDYAALRRMDDRQADPTLVARALLPESIREGTKLKYEMLQYSVIG